MTDKSTTDAQIRRRWINLGEFVAVAGLVISGLALWNSWSNSQGDKPAIAVEKVRAIPLALRGHVEDEGQAITLAPVEPGHALDSATVSANGRKFSVGSDGAVSAGAVEGLVGEAPKDAERGTLSVTVRARYIEAGTDRTSTARYRVSYRWVDGGLFGGRTLRLTGISRG